MIGKVWSPARQVIFVVKLLHSYPVLGSSVRKAVETWNDSFRVMTHAWPASSFSFTEKNFYESLWQSLKQMHIWKISKQIKQIYKSQNTFINSKINRTNSMGTDASSHSSPSPSQKRIFPEGFALSALRSSTWRGTTQLRWLFRHFQSSISVQFVLLICCTLGQSVP